MKTQMNELMKAAHTYARTQFPVSMSYRARLSGGLQQAWYDRVSFNFYTRQDNANAPFVSRVKNPDHVAAQENYCKAHSLRNWVNLGDCFTCGRNVFDAYSVTFAANNQITGCPYCHRSFCE